jgi:hypothetical protein
MTDDSIAETPMVDGEAVATLDLIQSSDIEPDAPCSVWGLAGAESFLN